MVVLVVGGGGGSGSGGGGIGSIFTLSIRKINYQRL